MQLDVRSWVLGDKLSNCLGLPHLFFFFFFFECLGGHVLLLYREAAACSLKNL